MGDYEDRGKGEETATTVKGIGREGESHFQMETLDSYSQSNEYDRPPLVKAIVNVELLSEAL